ncbi:MAG: DEAD/DEAH box helicase [Candidatus Heimdallarchaeota archaeon]
MDSTYQKQICHIEFFPKQPAKYGSLKQPLATPLDTLLRKRKYRLYSHQAEAIELLLQGENAIVTTPTASGKSLIFLIPILNALLADDNASALLLYPTKALANDQLVTVRDFEAALQLDSRGAIYDGDTPSHQRATIRSQSRIILSNPYAIHQYLDWHQSWDTFLRTLRFVVIDEAHTYRGVFGSHCAQLLRRLRRLCQRHGSNPQFILSSATVANAEELAHQLVGKVFRVVSEDGSPKGPRTFVFWNPPLASQSSFLRRSPHQETRKLLRAHILANLQTLCFTPSRRMAELLASWTADDLEKEGADTSLVASYRAGYLPAERRQLEKQLRTRELVGVATTNALEVGIDVGSLDAVIISGFPGTIISTQQQAGRAGRGLTEALCTIVWFQDPLNQYYAQHPEIFFGKPPEHAIVDLTNRYILAGHLLCAAKEAPLNLVELEQFWPRQTFHTLQMLEKNGLVKKTSHGWIYAGEERPANVVQLSGGFGETIQVLWNKSLLETLTKPQAYREAHEGAVLLHQGEAFVVQKLDIEHGQALVEKVEVVHYTEALKHTSVEVLEIRQEETKGIPLKTGRVKVKEDYYGYRVRTTDEIIGMKTLDLPPLEFETVAFWFELPDDVKSHLLNQDKDLAGGLHAAEHALIALIPMLAMCDRWDIDGFSTVAFGTAEKAGVCVYDVFPGGIGIVEKCFERFADLVELAKQLIEDCLCESGCPSCVQSPRCGSNNEPLNKQLGAAILLELWLRLHDPGDLSSSLEELADKS